MTMKNPLAHPEREGPLLKRLGIGWGRSQRLRLLYRSSLEDIVSEHTDVSCCPGMMGIWLEKPDPAGCVNVVDEYGPWQGPGLT